jgi:GNAT superfamily N-acetyltransferase
VIVVRPAVPDDADLMADIRVTGWRESYTDQFTPEFLANLVADPEPFRREIDAGRSTMVVAELDGEVVGFAIARVPQEADAPRDRELALLYQYARAHGTGTGQALLDSVLGDQPAFLWTAELNLRAQAFYRRNGFVADGGHKIEPEWENLAEIRMVR